MRWAVIFLLSTLYFLPHYAQAHSDADEEARLSLGRLDRKLIQRGLDELNYKVGPTDGIFGPITRGALRKWQTATNRKATGYLTWEHAVTLMAVGRGHLTPEQALITAERQKQAYQKCLGANGWQDYPHDS